MKNPSWTRDELILALDLYFREPSARGSKTHPAVAELSELLNKLPLHSADPHDRTYRNPNGVGMKLSNFLRFDPEYQGEGLKRGGKLEQEVWDAFANDRTKLQQVAEAIRAGAVDQPPLGEQALQTEDEDEEAAEGRLLTRQHQYRERQPGLVRKKKAKVLQETGKLACEVCGFDFKERYGELGEGFAECHHTKPLSELEPGQKTRLSDLAIVCANCHRMLHRGKQWLTPGELRSRMTKGAT